MTPMIALREKLATLLAADSATLAPAANANKMMLFTNSVTETENLSATDLVEANFDGYAAIDGTVGTQETGIDPATGDQIITMTPPLAGWRWKTTGVTNMPQNVFGFALVDHTKATLLAVEMFTTPITLNDVGQQIDLGAATMRIVQEPMS